MAAGYIVKGECVGVATAQDVLYSGLPPSVTPGVDVYSAQFYRLSGVWNLLTYKNGVHTASYPMSPMFASCDTTAPFFDGLTIGWGVVAAMVVAWAIHVLRRAI